MKRALITSAIALLAVPAAASARTYTVHPGEHIADAVNAAVNDGDVVHVQAGAYAEPAMTVAHAIRIEGEPGTTVTATDATKPLFTVSSDGVTISTLTASSAGNTVVSATSTSGATAIDHSLLVNTAGGGGSKVPAVLGADSLAISDSLIVSGAGEGPALRLTGGAASSLVRTSVAATDAGSNAVEVQSGSGGAKQLTIDSSILSGGAGGASLSAAATLPSPLSGPITVKAVHATIAGAAAAVTTSNVAIGGPAIAVTVDRSIVRGTLGGVTPTSSDTSDANVFVDAAAKNFHLRADATSVIDRGGPAVAGESDRDIDGQPRVVGAASDLGADEFVNQAPIGRLAAPATVRTPGATTFDASASSDPEAGAGGGIAANGYHFDFGDGTSLDSSTPVVSHAYARPGRYAATVTVTDVQGLAGAPSAPVEAVVVDGIAPSARIISPRNGRKLRVRAPIRFTGSAADDVGVAAVGLTLRRIGTSKLTKITVHLQQGIWSYKVPKKRKLRRGRYELKAYAVDTTGNVSQPARVRFTLK